MSFFSFYTHKKCLSTDDSLETIKKKKKVTTLVSRFHAFGGFLRYSVMSMSGLPKSILSFVRPK